MAGNPLVDTLGAFAATSPEHPLAWLPDGSGTSHGAILARARRIAAVLLAHGLQPGDRVAAQVEKSLAVIELYLGTVLAGGVFLPLNPAYTPEEMAYFLGDATPRILVCDPGRVAGLAAAARAAEVAAVLCLDAQGGGSLAEAADAAGPAEVRARGDEDLAAILYTSGTTGRSKGAMLSHRALLSNARTLVEAWRFDSRDVLIHALPVFHTHGLFVATNVVLLAGASMVFLPRFDPAEVLAAMARSTTMMGVPTFYTRLLADPGLTRETCAGMRLFISGSAPLLAATHAAWAERTGHAILERYGMTETNMNTSNPHDGPRRPGTVGLPLPGVSVRITDTATGAPLETGELGMIEVRGPNLFSGYWRMPEKTAEEMRADGYFITGDLGCFDAEGYLSIVGREKDLIIAGGLNIYPKEIEELLDALPGVTESAVIGVPHPDLGEAAVAVVVGAPELSEAHLLAALDGRLARFKQPRRILIARELPRNTMGKVQKALLRQSHAGLFGA